jgi:hypothetical protein
VCSYDLDQTDEAWLKVFNGERSQCGLPSVNEEQFERIVEELEVSIFGYSIYFSDNINFIMHFQIRFAAMTKYKQ